jgi:serine/threonine protein kinase
MTVLGEQELVNDDVDPRRPLPRASTAFVHAKSSAERVEFGVVLDTGGDREVQADADRRLGTVVAGFRLERVLGRGGMGVVYLARSLEGERLSAIKLIAPEFSRDKGLHDRFARELRMARAVDDANIVRVRGTGEVDGLLYILMQYIEGPDLGALIKKRGFLDPGRAAEVIREVASALDAAHGQRLLHRDVKPANILVADVDGQAYLADFGLAVQVGAHTRMTRTGQWVGSVDYMAPERFEDDPEDARTDVYSLGCVLYQALTGEVPYPKSSDPAKGYAHVHEPPPAPTARRRELSPAFDAVIERALAKNPAERYASAGKLAAAATAAARGAAPTGFPDVQQTREGRLLPERPDEHTTTPEGRRPLLKRLRPPSAKTRRAQDPTSGRKPPQRGSSTVAETPDTEPRKPEPTPVPDPEETRQGQLPPQPIPGNTQTEPTRSGRPAGAGRAAAAAGVLVVLAAATVGVVALATSDGGVAYAKNAVLSIRLKASWHKVSTQSSGESATLVDPIAVGLGGASLSAGVLKKSSATPGGVPPQLVISLGTPTGASTTNLGRYPARRYSWSVGATQTVAFVLASSAADIAFICRGNEAAISACTAIANTITVAVGVESPGPDRTLSAKIATALQFLGATRTINARMSNAPLQVRAQRARQIATYALASEATLSRVTAPTRNQPALQELVTALHNYGTKWIALATAASRSDREGYTRARYAVIRADRALSLATSTMHEEELAAPPAPFVVPPVTPKFKSAPGGRASTSAPAPAAPAPAHVVPQSSVTPQSNTTPTEQPFRTKPK